MARPAAPLGTLLLMLCLAGPLAAQPSEEAVQDVVAQQNSFLARDAGHGGFVTVDE